MITYSANLDIFCKNYNKLQYKALGKPEDFFFMDWSDEELSQLGQLSYQFSGVQSYYLPVDYPQETEFTLSREPREFKDEGLLMYGRKSKPCSTSWATAIVEVAEAAVDKQYTFSVEQLLQCLPIEFDIDDVCSGVEPKTIISYLNEIGLVQKKHFIGCDAIKDQITIKFESKIPVVPNKSGLMQLVVEQKPVFVMLALNLPKLRFTRDEIVSEEPMRAGHDQPTMYGIVSGYQADGDYPYWEIVSHLVPTEEIRVRIPMTVNETNANYGGIAGFAFTLTYMDEYEIPEDLGDISVKEGDACSILNNKGYGSITLDKTVCSDYSESINISNNPYLQSFVADSMAFVNAPSLVISNNPMLESIEFKPGERDRNGITGSPIGGAFHNTETLEISSIDYFSIRKSIFLS